MLLFFIMSSPENPQVLTIGAIAQALVAEGATNAWVEGMAGLRQYGHELGAMVLHRVIERDGVKQLMTDSQNFALLRAAGIPVASLDRQIDATGTVPVYTQEQLDTLTSFVTDKDVITVLEEHPLTALSQLDKDALPPVLVNLYRASDYRTEDQMRELKEAAENGVIAGFTVDADASKDSYVRRGLSPNSITVIHNGVDLEKFAPSQTQRNRIRNELGIGINDPVIRFVGRNSPEKDIPLFLRSARIYLETVPDGHIIMTGTGLSRENPAIANLLAGIFGKDSNLLTRLHALGLRPDTDRPALYNAADVLALTSATESRPLCITEAQACGLGVAVSTDVGDARIMIGEHGFITSRDPEVIAKCWQEAYAQRKEIGFPIERREELGTQQMILRHNQTLQDILSPASRASS